MIAYVLVVIPNLPQAATATSGCRSGATHESQFETIHPDDHELIYRRHRRAREETGEFEPEYRLLQPRRRRSDPLLRTRFARLRRCPDRLVGVTLEVTKAGEPEIERECVRAFELTALAEAAERERIIRELHDRVAYHMGVAHHSP